MLPATLVELDQNQGGLETGAKALVGTLVVGEQGVTLPPNQAGSDSKDRGDYAAHTCPGGGISDHEPDGTNNDEEDNKVVLQVEFIVNKSSDGTEWL